MSFWTDKRVLVTGGAGFLGAFEEVGFIGKIAWAATKPNGQPRRCLDVTRAREWFQFETKTPFRQGLDKTIAWHLAQRKSSGEVLSTADRI